MGTRPLTTALTAALLGVLALTPAAGAQTITGDLPSGNIDTIQQVGPSEWSLTIRPDTGGDKRQWFHFAVADAGGLTLTFVLNNVSDSAPWVNGMSPCVTTDLADESSWSRVDPADVSFGNQDVTFSYSFADDTPHHFAYSFVYPVERADALVDAIAALPFVTSRVIAQTLQGRDVELLEITEGQAADKLGVWIQARQHPAECGSSWTCEGLLEWLVGDSVQARGLRQAAEIRVVPMMNPDGVALGNYRTNSAGYDLNREWDMATPQSVPSVVAVNAELAAFDAAVGLDLFLDLHTHSGELKSFVFGVDGDPAFDALERGWAEELEAHAPDFSYAGSSWWGVEPGVAKNHVYAGHPDTLCYTHEQTIHTVPYGPHADEPITVARYVQMGQAIGTSLVSFFELPVDDWTDLGHALAGSLGEPRLTATGTLVGGTPVSFALDDARAQSTAWFLLGLGQIDAPFKGGVLVPDPSPPGLLLALPTGPAGALLVGDQWPQGLPGGLDIVVQWWVADPAGPVGFAASAGVRGTTP